MPSRTDLSCPVRSAARPGLDRPAAWLAAMLLTGALLALGSALPARAQTEQPQDGIQTFQAPTGQAPTGQEPSGQEPAGQAPAGQGPAEAGTVSPPERFGDWVRRCTDDPPNDAAPPKQGQQEVCFITQQLVDQDNQRPVMKVTVGFFKPDRRPMAVIALPLGVPLAGGVQVGVDGKGVAGVPFQFCRPDGCQAYLPLSDEVLGAFKAGQQAVVQLRRSQDQTIDLAVSLSGFTAGYGSIE